VPGNIRCTGGSTNSEWSHGVRSWSLPSPARISRKAEPLADAFDQPLPRGSVCEVAPRRNSRTVRAIGPVAAGIAWLVLIIVLVHAQRIDTGIEGSTEASMRASEVSIGTPLAWPDTTLIPGSQVEASGAARLVPEHAFLSQATVAAPSQNRPSVVLADAAATAASRSDQRNPLDGAAALGPNQSDPKPGSPATAAEEAVERAAAERAAAEGAAAERAAAERAAAEKAAAEKAAAEKADAERAAADKAAAEKQAAKKAAAPDANGPPGVVAVKGSVGPAEGGAAGLVFRIELSRPAERTVVLIYGTVDGTAKAGQHYEPRQGIITLAPGDTNADVYVPLKQRLSRKDNARFELFLTADPDVVEVVDQRITAVIALARPDTALVPGSRVDAGVPARPLPEHVLQSDATVAAPLQDRPSPVLSDDAAAAGSWVDQSKALGGAAALAPNQSAGRPAPAQVEENEPWLRAEEESEKPALYDEPRQLTDESRQEPADLAEAATAEPARLHSVAPEQTSSESSTSEHSGAPSAGIRIFIHYASSDVASAALAHRLAGYLQRMGFAVADIRTVDFGIGRPSVRYFFARDRAASWRLVGELGRFFKEAPSRAPDQASDFTHFVPKPRPGNVELWLPTS